MSNKPVWWRESLLDPGTSAGTPRAWRPAADVYRTNHGWLIKLDVAGVRPGDIRVVVEGRSLTVVGQRRDSMVRRGLASYSLEISYNRFERSISLPTDVESCAVRTEFEEGMLLIWLDKPSQTSP